ncbi:MAG TPA: hypothetical protein VEK57_27205 [Thermoanaerobaculia bacterium]|nr:hypothetical protein [Thermoanaerobaculia bacterium]
MNSPHHRDTQNAFRKAAARALCIIVLAVLGLSSAPAEAQTPWSLTKIQRQAYLNYYAPVLLKRGDENSGKQGRDWLANFDFDRDGNFSNNRLNWLNIDQYLAAAQSGSGAYSNWRIRPTLYTAVIEYMDGGSKSLVLLYHVYNAADKDGSEIHDWERIEIVVHGVTGTPGGSGEYFNHATVTMHKEQIMRRYYDSGLTFMQTATGKHVMIWQADESNLDGPTYGYHAHALHHVATPYSTIAGQMNSSTADAKVAVTQSDSKNVHYVFVPEGSQSAVNTWQAKPLAYWNASGLASRVDNGDTVKWTTVKRLTYELQDIADIIPTHWSANPWYTHWTADDLEDVLMESPVLNEAGVAEVSTGMQRFYTKSKDIGKSSLTDGREGVPSKKWFYGGYSAELNFEAPYDGDEFGGFEGLGVDSYGRTRGAASGYYDSHNSYLWQHDFFVHSGIITSDSTNYEAGMWLAGAWYTAANGGFDGRWVQLFDDRPTYEAPAPPPVVCNPVAQQQCEISGGTWKPLTCSCKALCTGCQIP